MHSSTAQTFPPYPVPWEVFLSSASNCAHRPITCAPSHFSGGSETAPALPIPSTDTPATALTPESHPAHAVSPSSDCAHTPLICAPSHAPGGNGAACPYPLPPLSNLIHPFTGPLLSP
jgi:hypothetical protein